MEKVNYEIKIWTDPTKAENNGPDYVINETVSATVEEETPRKDAVRAALIEKAVRDKYYAEVHTKNSDDDDTCWRYAGDDPTMILNFAPPDPPS